MRGLRGHPARYEATRGLVSVSSFAGASVPARYLGRDQTNTLTLDDRWLPFERDIASFWNEAGGRGVVAAWHKKCFGLIMLELVVACIFGVGFCAGYGVRALVSRRRRRSYRRSLA